MKRFVLLVSLYAGILSLHRLFGRIIEKTHDVHNLERQLNNMARSKQMQRLTDASSKDFQVTMSALQLKACLLLF